MELLYLGMGQGKTRYLLNKLTKDSSTILLVVDQKIKNSIIHNQIYSEPIYDRNKVLSITDRIFTYDEWEYMKGMGYANFKLLCDDVDSYLQHKLCVTYHNGNIDTITIGKEKEQTKIDPRRLENDIELDHMKKFIESRGWKKAESLIYNNAYYKDDNKVQKVYTLEQAYFSEIKGEQS